MKFTTTPENVNMALAALWAHRFRSALTILGIVIGITTVVTVSSLLTGLREGIVVFFQEFGPDNIFLARFSGDPASGGRPNEQKRRPIRPEYAAYIERTCPSVLRTSVSLFIPTLVAGRPIVARVPAFESDNVSLVGLTYSGFLTQPRELLEGRLFTPEEAARGDKVAMLGPSLAEALFPSGSAVGRSFTLDGAEYRITGVFAPAKGGFFGENSLDFQVSIPLRTAQLRYPQVDNYYIISQARPGMRDQAVEEVRAAMRRLRRIPPGAPDDFSLTTPDQIIRRFDSLTRLVLMVSIALSALGLLVGGIGVMNIMLVSVTERTKEIGIRKAIGARRGDIGIQFLTEAMTLTGVGGLLGILLAVLATLLIGYLRPSLPSQVPTWAIFAGLGVSLSVGLFFGVWPALKAAKLDPVEALRYE
jgi:putative ABC transport system permease protein